MIISSTHFYVFILFYFISFFWVRVLAGNISNKLDLVCDLVECEWNVKEWVRNVKGTLLVCVLIRILHYNIKYTYTHTHTYTLTQRGLRKRKIFLSHNQFLKNIFIYIFYIFTTGCDVYENCVLGWVYSILNKCILYMSIF